MTGFQDECAAVHPAMWDAKGSFVCRLAPGHPGAHKSRPRKGRAAVRWQAEGGP